MEREYKYKGYSFYSKDDYLNAKKENEIIEYVKAKTNLTDTDKKIALYNKFVDRGTLKTVVGIDFLKSLRNDILKNELVKEEVLKPLPTPESKRKIIRKPVLTHVQRLEKENVGLKIIIFGLVIIIIGMFVIVMTGKSSPLKSVYEEEIINKYAGWADELTAKEKKINDALYFLEQNGIYFDENTEE